jgi:hypothetical protein
MLGYLTADLMVTPRVLVAFARDGLMHSVLARLHARSKAPHIAISGTFAALAVLATLTSAALYVMVYGRRGSWLAVASPIGIDGMGGAIALALQEEDHRVVGTHRGVRCLLAADAGGRNVRVKRQRY